MIYSEPNIAYACVKYHVNMMYGIATCYTYKRHVKTIIQYLAVYQLFTSCLPGVY